MFKTANRIAPPPCSPAVQDSPPAPKGSEVSSHEVPIDSFKQLTERGLSFTMPTKHGGIPITIENPRKRIGRPRSGGLDFAMRYQSMDKNLVGAALSFYSVPVTVADMTIGGEHFVVSMASSHFDRHAIALTRPNIPMTFLSLCNARYHTDKLDIYETYTKEILFGNGYSSILSRLAFLVAGRPPLVVMSEVISTSPLWGLLAKTHIDTGEFKPFDHPLFGEYAERIFGVPLVNIKILPASRIRVKRTRDWKLRVTPRSVFYIDINLDPNSK